MNRSDLELRLLNRGAPDWKHLNEVELGWMESAARKLDDTALCERIKQERKLKANTAITVARQGELPELVAASASPDKEVSDDQD